MTYRCHVHEEDLPHYAVIMETEHTSSRPGGYSGGTVFLHGTQRRVHELFMLEITQGSGFLHAPVDR